MLIQYLDDVSRFHVFLGQMATERVREHNVRACATYHCRITTRQLLPAGLLEPLTGSSNTKWQRAMNLTLQLITSGRQPTGDNRWIPNHEPSVE